MLGLMQCKRLTFEEIRDRMFHLPVISHDKGSKDFNFAIGKYRGMTRSKK